MLKRCCARRLHHCRPRTAAIALWCGRRRRVHGCFPACVLSRESRGALCRGGKGPCCCTRGVTRRTLSRRGDVPVFKPNSETGGHALQFYPLKVHLPTRSSSHPGSVTPPGEVAYHARSPATDGPRYAHIETGVAASWVGAHDQDQDSPSPSQAHVSNVRLQRVDSVRQGTLRASSTRGDEGDFSPVASPQKQRALSTPPYTSSAVCAANSLTPPLRAQPSAFLAARSQWMAERIRENDGRPGRTTLQILTDGSVRIRRIRRG